MTLANQLREFELLVEACCSKEDIVLHQKLRTVILDAIYELLSEARTSEILFQVAKLINLQYMLTSHMLTLLRPEFEIYANPGI